MLGLFTWLLACSLGRLFPHLGLRRRPCLRGGLGSIQHGIELSVLLRRRLPACLLACQMACRLACLLLVVVLPFLVCWGGLFSIHHRIELSALLRRRRLLACLLACLHAGWLAGLLALRRRSAFSCLLRGTHFNSP